MDDPNITMEEYIRIEEEKARRRAIVFNNTLTSEATLSCEPTVSSLNDNEIDFRISFDESDDEDCMPTVSCSDDLDFFKDFENELWKLEGGLNSLQGRDEKKRLDHLKQDQEMLVIKIFSERKKVFRERKKCEKIRAKRFDFQQGMEQYL
ncbi:hypothetical protein Tco_0660901 [Tanacetum coccineum]